MIKRSIVKKKLLKKKKTKKLNWIKADDLQLLAIGHHAKLILILIVCEMYGIVH